MARIGVLALQGDFAAHAKALGDVGAETVEVRRPEQLAALDGLVVPGGESTTLLNLMADGPWFDALRAFHAREGAILGTCAGTILLAREVLDPVQPSLGLLDATVRRNAFGRQIDSFETELALEGETTRLPAVFIRAPRLVRVGAGVEVLARLGDEPVLVRQGRILAATFHPELTGDRRLQARFLELVRGSATAEADLVEARRATC
jgi:5'-phosphate synthase pdxT subunit